MHNEHFTFTPLGGGREIGANCWHMTWDNLSILIDCGAHPERIGYDSIPSLFRLNHLDAILVTHAHHDHIGSLPYLHRVMPDVPVYMSRETRELAEIMLNDSVKFQQDMRTIERRGLFFREDVEHLLAQVEPLEEVFLIRGMRVTAFDNGHILGSKGLLFEKNNKRLLFTSDIAREEHRAAPSCDLPEGPIDLLISETTYGRDTAANLYQSRKSEAEAIVEKLRPHLLEGGSAIFPAFVIERVQEIVLILNQAMERGELPDIPLYVGGLGIPISRIHEKYLDLELEYIALGRENFDSVFAQIRSGSEPAIVVTGSGMLNSGSTAARFTLPLLERENCAIFFTGYCAPHTQGRRLLEHQSGPLYLNGEVVPSVAAKIYRFHLSCHATGHDLLELINRYEPEHLILTHGDDEAIDNFISAIESRAQNGAWRPSIYAPANDETLSFGEAKSGLLPALSELKQELSESYGITAVKSARSILEVAPWDRDAMRAILEHGDREREMQRIQEKYVALLRLYIERAMTEGNLNAAREALVSLSGYESPKRFKREEKRLRRLEAQMA